jgi:hypothetical protein
MASLELEKKKKSAVVVNDRKRYTRATSRNRKEALHFFCNWASTVR